MRRCHLATATEGGDQVPNVLEWSSSFIHYVEQLCEGMCQMVISYRHPDRPLTMDFVDVTPQALGAGHARIDVVV